MPRKKLRSLYRLTPEKWLALSQAEQLDLYNLCVDSLNELSETMDDLGTMLRTTRGARCIHCRKEQKL